MTNFIEVPLCELKPSKNNPRKTTNKNTIEELAQSIANDGILQNIIVVKAKGKKLAYNIVGGNRRYAACMLLVEKGTFTKDQLIPVQVMTNTNKQDLHRIATIENIQREDMPILDEADAITALVQGNMPLEEISAQTGISVGTIRKRIALSGLSDNSRKALLEGVINLAQAEALTVGTHEQQAVMIEDVINCQYRHFSADEIKEQFIDEKPTVSLAMFDKEEYKGDLTKDLFGEEESTYFNDIEQFEELQDQAVEDMAAQYRTEGYWPVGIVRGYSCPLISYREAEDEEKGAIVIHLHPSGRVQVFDKIVKLELNEDIESDVSNNSAVSKKPKPTYSKPLCEYMAMHKSAAVQAELLNNPRIAKQVAVVQLMSRFSTYECHGYFEGAMDRPAAFKTLDGQIREFLILLNRPEREDHHYLGLLPKFGCSDRSTFYQSLKSLSDDELDRLHLLLSTLSFGQSYANLDTHADSVFNQVAIDLEVNMSDYWNPDEDFLSRRNLGQLQGIISETDTGRVFGLAKQYKKSDIVRMLSKHFGKLASIEKPDKQDLAAANWLPEAMSFPAIDPDKVQDEPEEIAIAA